MNNELNTPAGSIKMVIMNDEYLVRVMKPANNTPLSELHISLQRNRDMLKESYLSMCASCRDDISNRVDQKHIDHISPTQNALVARANIDLLIPLINVKGGVATYEGKLEGLPIEKHVEKLRNKAEDNARKEESKTRINGFLMIAIVLILITVFLSIFN